MCIRSRPTGIGRNRFHDRGLQDEMRMSEAQNNYLSAHYNYQVANLALLKLTGQMDRLLQGN